MRLKRAGIITKTIVFVLVIYAMVSILRLRAKIDIAESEQDALRRELAAKELSNAEREYEIENKDDDDVIASIAREVFGLVKAGERVYYDFTE